MTVHAYPLVDDYLRRLRAAAADLPPARREELVAEIREHLAEATRQIPAGEEAGVRNALDRLGTPEEIAAAAADQLQPGQVLVRTPDYSGLAITSLSLAVLWFFGLGSVAALILGYRARRVISGSEGRLKGSGLAVAGIILGWIGIASVIVAAVALLFLFASSSGSVTHS